MFCSRCGEEFEKTANGEELCGCDHADLLLIEEAKCKAHEERWKALEKVVEKRLKATLSSDSIGYSLRYDEDKWLQSEMQRLEGKDHGDPKDWRWVNKGGGDEG